MLSYLSDIPCAPKCIFEQSCSDLNRRTVTFASDTRPCPHSAFILKSATSRTRARSLVNDRPLCSSARSGPQALKIRVRHLRQLLSTTGAGRNSLAAERKAFMADKPVDVVICPLCAGTGEVNKHLAIVRLRSPQFRDVVREFEDDVLSAKEDPFEVRQAVNTPENHTVTHRSWKE